MELYSLRNTLCTCLTGTHNLQGSQTAREEDTIIFLSTSWGWMFCIRVLMRNNNFSFVSLLIVSSPRLIRCQDRCERLSVSLLQSGGKLKWIIWRAICPSDSNCSPVWLENRNNHESKFLGQVRSDVPSCFYNLNFLIFISTSHLFLLEMKAGKDVQGDPFRRCLSIHRPSLVY